MICVAARMHAFSERPTMVGAARVDVFSVRPTTNCVEHHYLLFARPTINCVDNVLRFPIDALQTLSVVRFARRQHPPPIQRADRRNAPKGAQRQGRDIMQSR